MEGLMAEYLQPRRCTRTCAQPWKELRRKKAILSNGSPDMLLPLVEHSGLELDAVISVDELKIFKPAPQVYELAVKKLDTEKADRLRLLELLGRARREVVRLQRLLDQPRGRAGRPPGLQARPDVCKSLDEILL